MNIREIEIATDPSDFDWRRYIADTPDYEGHELYIPTEPIAAGHRTVEYKLGNHVRRTTTAVFRKVIHVRDLPIAVEPAPRTTRDEFDFQCQRQATDDTWRNNLPTRKPTRTDIRFAMEDTNRVRSLLDFDKEIR
tara:strand:- start:942 stop:1346 length:405 start_codon:yes stop_codon:yes gene_type:complete